MAKKGKGKRANGLDFGTSKLQAAWLKEGSFSDLSVDAYF